jgi:hypothetical protein
VGVSPVQAASLRAEGNRVMSPVSATRVCQISGVRAFPVSFLVRS